MPSAKLNVPMPVAGLSTGKPSEFIDNRATPDCQNVEFSRFAIAKRIGESLMGTSANERILALAELQRGTSRYFVRIGLTKFEEFSSNTWTSRANAPLNATEAETVSYAFPVLSGQKILAYTNGIDNIRKWTSSGNDASLGGSPPKAKYLIAFGPYLVLLNVTDSGDNFGSRVQWCDTGNIEQWTTGNAGSTNLIDDTQDITGGSLYSDGITVHKENCIYVGYLVSTSDVFRFDRRNTGVGTVANATIQNLPDGRQIFLATDGLHVFNGVTAPLLEMEGDITYDLRDGANPQYIHKSISKLVKEKDEYWVAVPIGSQTEPETVYKYNYRTNQMYKDTRSGLSCFGAFEATNQVTWNDLATSWDALAFRWDDVINLTLAPIVSFGHSDGTVTKRQGIYNDNDEAISAYWISKDFTAGDYGLDDQGTLLRWTGMDVWAKGTSVTVSYSIDGGSTWIAIRTATLSGDYPTDASPLSFYFDVVSSRIRFRFLNDDDDSAFTLKQFMPVASVRENRR
jgi:hypothetical protein